MTTTPEHPLAYFETTAGKATLWLGVLLPPAAWLTQFQVNYALARWLCDVPWLAVFYHLTSALMLLVALTGGWLAWRDWTMLRGHAPAEHEAGVQGRSHFLALLGLSMTPLFALLILGQWAARFFIDPCIY
jgi:hypothetical protein